MTLTKVWSKYNNSFNFIKKGEIDVNALSIFLLGKEEYFNKQLNLTHHQHGKALIIQDYPRNWFYPAPFTPEFKCDDEELWSLTKPIIDKLEKDCDGKAAKIFYFLLPAGTNIYIHMDMGQYFSAVHRHQIPITTNPQCESWVDGETINMKTGEIWEINNVKRHAVDNNGTTPRINLVVDIMPMWAIEAKEDGLEGISWAK